MKTPKVHILFKFQLGPWGGGNQFLKALKNYFIQEGVYEEDPIKADCILVNSHHNLKDVLRMKYTYPRKIVIHRIDGPVSKIRGTDYKTDKIIYKFNKLIADATVFQSNWSQEENYKLGMKKNSNNTVIINAPDPKIFNRENRIKFERNRKTRVIATSWSANWRKGFDIYQYLDENLDFSKYEMTFVGNSPVKFKNIKCIKPLDSRRLAEQLKQQDIFITASKKDPCSNSLIEALHCGLPAIALNDGGHPEIIGKGGEVFVSNKDVIKKIEIVTKNYHYYQDQIRLQNIDAAGETYYQFIKSIFSKYENKEYFPKKVYLHQCLRLLLSIYGWQLKSKFRSLIG